MQYYLNQPFNQSSLGAYTVYVDHRPQDQMSMLDAMNAACEDITADHCRGWVRHSSIFFTRCMAVENIRCDVDENLWPDLQEWPGCLTIYFFFPWMLFCSYFVYLW